MPCFGSKRVEVVPCTTEDGATEAPTRVSSAKGRKGAGRLESEDKSEPHVRDGLHSAPTSQDRTSSNNDKSRAGLHSAPHGKANDKANESKAPAAAEPIGDFIIEAPDGNQPTAAAVDSYLHDVIGPRIVKDLRGAEWAARVAGIEALQQLVKRHVSEAAVATGHEVSGDDIVDRATLFRACVTVMARALSDKVVPVFLPAIALLAEVYSPSFLAPLASGKLPKVAIACFANHLVLRAGSSNVRAREESSAALLSLARNDAVGCAAISPWALRTLSNSKSAHAAVGRLELLRTLVAEFGMGAESGLQLRDVLVFALPLCECAAEKSRDAAIGLVLDIRATADKKADRLVEELRPSVMPTIKSRLAPPESKSDPQSLSVSGKRLPPLPSIGTTFPGALPGSMPSGDDGEELLAVQGTPPDASGRSRARTTATELGARNAPPPKKKLSKGVRNSASADPDDADGLLAEANSIMGERPRPVRLAAGNAGKSPSKHARGPVSGAVDIADEDEVSQFMTEEQLMEQILEQTK